MAKKKKFNKKHLWWIIPSSLLTIILIVFLIGIWSIESDKPINIPSDENIIFSEGCYVKSTFTSDVSELKELIKDFRALSRFPEPVIRGSIVSRMSDHTFQLKFRSPVNAETCAKDISKYRERSTRNVEIVIELDNLKFGEFTDEEYAEGINLIDEMLVNLRVMEEQATIYP